MDIEDDHPLRRTAFIDDVWPCLRILTMFKKKRKPDFRNALKLCFYKEMDIRVASKLVGHDHGCGENDENEESALI